jgi:hypothetical protein
MQHYSSEEEKNFFITLWNDIAPQTISKINLSSSIVRKSSLELVETARYNCLLCLNQLGFFEDSPIYQLHLKTKEIAFYKALTINDEVVQIGEFLKMEMKSRAFGIISC